MQRDSMIYQNKERDLHAEAIAKGTQYVPGLKLDEHPLAGLCGGRGPAHLPSKMWVIYDCGD